MRRRARFLSLSAARALGWALGVTLLAVLVARLWSLWSKHPVDLGEAHLGLLALGVLATAVAVPIPGLIWVQLLRWLGVPAPWSWISLYLRAQLGKYLPGGVWQYAGRAALARFYGAPLWPAGASLAIEIVTATTAAAFVGLAALYPWHATIVLLVAVPSVLLLHRSRAAADALAAAFRRLVPVRRAATGADVALAGRAGARTTLLFLPLWIFQGVGLWLLAYALFGVSAADLRYFVGAFALGSVAGLVAVFAPGGLGVREAVLAALLTPKIGEADAIALALSSRVILIAADVGGGAAALVLPTRRIPTRRTPAPNHG
jgi:uncharacterized membrane protein YbhN (UPF0104 family)